MSRPAPLSLCVLVVLLLCAAVASASLQSLDPETYAEPLEAEYWPEDLPRYQMHEVTRDLFRDNVLGGFPFVVTDLGRDWPMSSWDCDFFRRDPLLRGAEMVAAYGSEGSGAKSVRLGEDWPEAAASRAEGAGVSAASDSADQAPQASPYYWGIKDVQYQDTSFQASWTSAMLSRVQESMLPPSFMGPENAAQMRRTPEFWFTASPGSGAKAHVDSHVEWTLSLQLSGAKRWRLGPIGPRRAPFAAPIYRDGDVYAEGRGAWRPRFEVLLGKGQAILFPPGFVHETKMLDETAAVDVAGVPTNSTCGVSVNFQFSKPLAARFYRRFLPRVRRTADLHEAWPLLETWASLGSQVPQAGLDFGAAREQGLGSVGAGAAFDTVDSNSDGLLSAEELQHRFGEEAINFANFHDLDEDGRVSRAEFAEVFGLWAGTVKAVYDETPHQYRDLQLRHLELGIGDMNNRDAAPVLRAAWEGERQRQREEQERRSGEL